MDPAASGCVSTVSLVRHATPFAPQKFTPESIEFQSKILARSGLGDDTYLPPGLAQQPPAISMSDARWEFEQVSRNAELVASCDDASW
jgi:hypothetical protein